MTKRIRRIVAALALSTAALVGVAGGEVVEARDCRVTYVSSTAAQSRCHHSFQRSIILCHPRGQFVNRVERGPIVGPGQFSMARCDPGYVRSGRVFIDRF